MKKIKVMAAGFAAAVAVGVLCGCAPIYGRVGQLFDSMREVRTEAEERHGEWPEEADLAGDYFGTMAEAAYGESEWAGNSLPEYEKYGITYDEVTGNNWFGEKPLAGMYDAGHNTVTIGAYADIGAYVIVERDAAGSIARIYETDQETFKALSGIDGLYSPKETAEAMGYSFHREDRSVKGLDKDAFARLENELRMKYRNENAMVECRDDVFYFGREDLFSISSFCSSDVNRYGARAYIDYHSGDMDLNLFDAGKTDQVILRVLKEETGSKKDVGRAVKEAVAKTYGIEEKYILIDIAEI